MSVVPGKVPFLISKPALKRMGAVFDMPADRLRLQRLGLDLPLQECPGSGHYQWNLCEPDVEVHAVAANPYREIIEKFREIPEVYAATTGFQ